MKLMVAHAASASAVALLVLAGCGVTTPSPSPEPSPTPTPTASKGVPATPTAAISPRPTASATEPQFDLPVEIQRIENASAARVTAFISLGHEIVWSGGERSGDDNLYRYAPGAEGPELLFRNPNQDSQLSFIAGSAAGYVFTDERGVVGEPRGWVLWYVAAAGAEPVLLDQSTDDSLPPPTIAMNDRYIVWEVIHGSWDDRTNALRVAPVNDPTGAVTLLSNRGFDSYIQYPSLWIDELWYGIADNDWDAGTEHPRIEMIDLANPAAAPQVFGSDQRAFMPAPGREVVAWKSGGGASLSALNSGALTIYWRATGEVETLPIPGPADAAARISYPSVGDRFVSWSDDIHQRLHVYDLGERRFRRIVEYDWAGDEQIFRPSLSGNLLAFVHSEDDRERYLEWALLPQ